MGENLCLHHPPACEGKHGRHGAQGQTPLHWRGPYNILAVDPCFAAEPPDGSPLGSNLPHIDLPYHLPGWGARRRAAMERCKPCAKPHDNGNMPEYLPAGLTQYMLDDISKASPPYHVTQEDVSTPLQRLEVEQITGHQSVRGRGGLTTVQYKTLWAGFTASPRCNTKRFGRDSRNLPGSWKWTSASSAPDVCVIGAPLPDQHRQTNQLHRRMRIRAAQGELSIINGERFVAPGYVTWAEWLRRYPDTVLLKGAHVWYKEDDELS